MQLATSTTQTTDVLYYDHQGCPLFRDVVYADEYSTACHLADDAGPSGIDFDIAFDDETRAAMVLRGSGVPTRRDAGDALRRKAEEPNRTTRENRRVAALHLPTRLIFGHFSNDDEGIEAFRILNRPAFVVADDATISDILVSAHDNLPDLNSGYLAGIDPFTGKVRMKLPLG